MASETGLDDSPAMKMRELNCRDQQKSPCTAETKCGIHKVPKSAKNPKHLSVTYVGVHYACLHVWVFVVFFFF